MRLSRLLPQQDLSILRILSGLECLQVNLAQQ